MGFFKPDAPQYKFNKRTLKYEKVEYTLWYRIRSVLRFIFTSALLGFGFFLFFIFILPSPAAKKLQKENEEISAHQEKLRRERQERENAIYQAIITGFINGMNNAVSGGTTRQGNKGNSVSMDRANVSTNAGVYDGNVTNSQNTSSGSTTRSINYSALDDWKARKANAERMIREYNQQLLKNPNDAAIKSMIRSQENILNNCIRQISLIESGAQ